MNPASRLDSRPLLASGNSSVSARRREVAGTSEMPCRHECGAPGRRRRCRRFPQSSRTGPRAHRDFERIGVRHHHAPASRPRGADRPSVTGDTAFPPRATVLLRRQPRSFPVAGPTRFRPRRKHGSRARSPLSAPNRPVKRKASIDIAPKLRTSEPRRSRKPSAGTSTRSRRPPTTATWSLPIGAEGRGTRA